MPCEQRECNEGSTTVAYVLTDGHYSDYHIVAVYLDKTLAVEAAERLGVTVEEFPVDSRRAVLLHWYCVEVNRNGEEVSRDEWTQYSLNPSPPDPEPRFNYPSECASGSSTRGYHVALKIARDRLAQYRVIEEGVG